MGVPETEMFSKFGLGELLVCPRKRGRFLQILASDSGCYDELEVVVQVGVGSVAAAFIECCYHPVVPVSRVSLRRFERGFDQFPGVEQPSQQEQLERQGVVVFAVDRSKGLDCLR